MSKGVGILSKPTLRKGLITLVNQGVVSATNFLTGVVIGRTCTKDEFGLYMLGFSIVLFALDLQVSLVSTPYMIYRPRLRGEDLHLYKGSSLLHQIVLSLALMAVLASWGGAVSLGFGPPGLEPVLFALVAVIGFIMLREFVRRVCFADLRMEIVLFFDICVALLQVGGLLLLAYYQVLSADRAYWVIGGACGLAGLGWILLNRKTFVVRTSRSLQDLKLNWTFGKWVFASGALWAISMNLYPWKRTSQSPQVNRTKSGTKLTLKSTSARSMANSAREKENATLAATRLSDRMKTTAPFPVYLAPYSRTSKGSPNRKSAQHSILMTMQRMALDLNANWRNALKPPSA